MFSAFTGNWLELDPERLGLRRTVGVGCGGGVGAAASPRPENQQEGTGLEQGLPRDPRTGREWAGSSSKVHPKAS